MPIREAPGGRRYYLIAFDKAGNERGDPDAARGHLSEIAVRDLSLNPITDVFFVIHGWKGDIPAAIDQFDNWIGVVTRQASDLARMQEKHPDYRPLIVGLHWPSQPWGDEEFASESSYAATPAAAGTEFDSRTRLSADEMANAYADRLSDSEGRDSPEWQEIRAAIGAIITEAKKNPAPATLPPHITVAYSKLDNLTNLGAADLAGAPGDDRDPFDPERAYRSTRAPVASYGGGLGDGLLSPLRQLSFWKMKKRAQIFGESGAAKLLSMVQAASPKARIHIAGHSFGCIVASGMLRRPGNSAGKKPPIHSAMLIQGALSLWSYCSRIERAGGKPGYFASVIEDARVGGPIVTTQSRYDRAVGFWYPKAAGVAGQVVYATDLGELPKYGGVGTFGLQGPGVPTVELNMLPATGRYSFQRGKVYNINSEQYIKNGGGFSGAHSDIVHPEVAHALWDAVLTD
jgi:hypothetical protein